MMVHDGFRDRRRRLPTEVRDLIRMMSRDNPIWGAPRIHGELLKLGIEISQATVSKYMVRHRKPPSQSWRTFLTNHAKDIVSADFFTVPTVTFRVSESNATVPCGWNKWKGQVALKCDRVFGHYGLDIDACVDNITVNYDLVMVILSWRPRTRITMAHGSTGR